MDEKNRIVVTNSLAAFVIRGFSLVVSFFSVPAYISYFNDNIVLGIWYTILSIIIWVLNFDLGIGNGIRNLLVKAISSNNQTRAKEVVSSGMLANLLVMLLCLLVGGFFIWFSDLNSLFNLPQNHISSQALTTATAFIFVAIMLRFFFTTISSVFYAIQQSMVNNLLGLCVSILQLIYVLSFRFTNTDEALIALAFSYIITSNLPSFLAGLIVFAGRLRFCSPSLRFAKKKIAGEIISLGGLFFFCQILYMIIMNTNEFFVTRFFGAENTVIFTFYYKIFFLISGAVSLAATPIWSMVTKAYVEKEFVWLNTLYRRIRILGFLSIACHILLIPFLQIIMDLWLGDSSPQVDYKIAFAFALFGGVFSYSSLLSTIACGLSRIKLQLFCYLIGVIVKIVLVVTTARLVNSWVIIIWSNVLVLAPYCILQQIDLKYFFQNESRKVVTD